MRDHIIAAYLENFNEKFDLNSEDESGLFEHFVNYCVMSKHHSDSFEPEEVSVGGGGDLGLDGLAIIVNDHLVFSRESVDHLKKSLRRLDVQFIAVQAKTSPKFDGGDIGTFLFGLRQFFDDTLPQGANDRIRELHALKKYIFDSSLHMESSPVCRVFYATTGVWNEDAYLRSRIDQGIKDLKATNLFSSVTFNPVDSEGIKRLYRELNNKIVREIVFERHTILPQIAGVQEAYIGIIPSSEYLNLICNGDGSLNRRLFYDNVRDFQGLNPVNMEIEGTIRDSERSGRFVLLNNGVTVVAKGVNKVGARFKLMDYQIVNGCQTSHILHMNKDHLTPDVYLPIKLIVTDDNEVTGQVTQGTNRQTEVKLEAFESLLPFQKRLEELYLALGRGRNEPLYYERRSKQYDDQGIRRERIITLATQINAFVAMFLNEPHSTHRYYGELLTSYRNRIFGESHSPLPYYTSGMALATVERLFADGILNRGWKKFKYQLLMIYRLQNETMELPPLNTKPVEKYCDGLLKKLDDRNETITAFKRAGELLETVLGGMGQLREPSQRTRAFTSALTEASAGKGSKAATTSKIVGKVKRFSDVLGWGLITTDSGEDVFVHYTGIIGTGYRLLLPGQQVQFAQTYDNVRDRFQAVDVEVLAPGTGGQHATGLSTLPIPKSRQL